MILMPKRWRVDVRYLLPAAGTPERPLRHLSVGIVGHDPRHDPDRPTLFIEALAADKRDADWFEGMVKRIIRGLDAQER